MTHYLTRSSGDLTFKTNKTCDVDNNGNTPLFEAIKNRHDVVVSMLVEAGAVLDINNAGNCLCMAVAKGDVEFLKRVLDNGINPNSKNYDLRTPLHIAAAEGSYSITKLILEAGGSVFSKDRYVLSFTFSLTNVVCHISEGGNLKTPTYESYWLEEIYFLCIQPPK